MVGGGVFPGPFSLVLLTTLSISDLAPVLSKKIGRKLNESLKLFSKCVIKAEKEYANHPVNDNLSPAQWLMCVILATQEAEIRRIEVQSQPGQIILETLS
jgi:hypothetical protein